jgi:hypothetical protein
MRRLVLIFLHLASADGYDVRPVTFKSWRKFRPVSTGNSAAQEVRKPHPGMIERNEIRRTGAPSTGR